MNHNEKVLQLFKKLIPQPYIYQTNLIDLTDGEIFTSERIEKMISKNGAYKLFFSTERVSSEVLKELFSLAKESKAIEKMRDMQSGKVMNRLTNTPPKEFLINIFEGFSFEGPGV